MDQFKRHLSAKSYWARIYISGPVAEIKQTCRHWVKENPCCVNVSKTSFIYPGGEETGACVELVNYPKFARSSEEILEAAKALGFEIKAATAQDSFLIATPTTTYWWSDREQTWSLDDITRSAL